MATRARAFVWRAAVLLLLTGALVGSMLARLDFPKTGIDDADIFIAYGRNLAQGYGLVYNPGLERVEGFTSVLWVLLTAAAVRVSGNVEAVLLIVNVVLVSLGIAAIWLYVDRGRRPTLAGAFVVLWALSSPYFVGWTTLTLMDTGLWSFLLCVGAAGALAGGRVWLLAAVTALLPWGRPEGLLWAPVLVLVYALSFRGGSRAALLRALRVPLLSYAGSVFGITAWRLLYFGYPLPNTFYAKVSPSLAYNLTQGARYLVAFVYANPLLLVALVPAISTLLFLVLRAARPRREPRSVEGEPLAYLAATSVLVVVSLGLPVLTGGDHFGGFRFFQPPWPLLILPAVAFARAAPERIPSRARLLVAVGLTIVTAGWAVSNWARDDSLALFDHEVDVSRQGRQIGAVLTQVFPDSPSVGVIRAGGVRLTYGGEILDLAGINSTRMAHSQGDRYGIKNHAAFNLDVFFQDPPDLLLPSIDAWEELCARWGELYEWNDTVLKGLLSTQRFTDDYVFATITRGEATLSAYAQRRFLDQLSPERYSVVVRAPCSVELGGPPGAPAAVAGLAAACGVSPNTEGRCRP